MSSYHVGLDLGQAADYSVLAALVDRDRIEMMQLFAFIGDEAERTRALLDQLARQDPGAELDRHLADAA